MTRRLLPLLSFLLPLLFQSLGQTPEWIWNDNNGRTPANNEVAYFRKTFVLKSAPERATLLAACDDQAVVYLNGKEVLKSPNWNRAVHANVRGELKQGENVLAVRGKNNSGIAALILKLEVTYAGGSTETIVSDKSWLASLKDETGWQTAAFQPQGWSKAISRGQLGVEPWGDVMSPPHATPAESLTLLPGFKVDLLRSSDNEGSWVSMTTDNKGRLIISPQEGRNNILRVTLGDDGAIAKMETIDLPVGGAMGLLYAFDSLYVSGGGPDGLALYRLKDTNGDDAYDSVQLLKKFEGAGGEHGSHALVLGPDNMIYYIHGNFVKVPSDISASSPMRNYAEDTLLPRAEDGNGFGVGIKPPGGFIVRGDPDGRHWELYAAGMRNAYDFDFNPEGEIFTFDSDMEWDWGMPWYRPTRIYHLVSGGDYGFREGTAKYPAYYPDILAPTYDIGIGSPTGVKFGTGAKFPEKYQKALYAMDWSYGRIFAVHLNAKGASYEAGVETFVKGKPLNVTDMVVGRDGALYFTTGGRGTQSGLYRVTYTGPASTEALAKNDSATSREAEARALRRKLESFHGRKDPGAVNFAWPHLRSEDRWIRYAARLAIESQDPETWTDRALEERDINGSLTALTALARCSKEKLQTEIVGAISQMNVEEMTLDQKLAAVRVMSLAFVRMGKPSPDLRDKLIAGLDELFPDRSDLLNREMAKLMIYLEAPSAVSKTLALLKDAPTYEDQIFYLFHLRTLKNGWTHEQRETYLNWFNQKHDNLSHPESLMKWFTEAGTSYRNGASFPKFMANIKQDAVNSLPEDERQSLAAVIAGEKPAPRAKAAEAPRQFVNDWKMEDFAKSLDQVSSRRSYEKGRAAFEAAQCLACHRFGNEGGSVGPDLTSVSSRFARRDLLESIIDPSKVVSEQYQNMNIQLKDGEDVSGRLVDETNEKYVVLVNPLENTRVDVKKRDIEQMRPSTVSPMPAGLINILGKDEVLDLLAYMESGGNAKSANFK